MTVAGLIGCSIEELGFEYDYHGPYNNALYNLLTEYVGTLQIDKAITGAVPGADFVWAWVAMAEIGDLVCLTACQRYGENWTLDNKERLQNIKIAAGKTITLGQGSSSDAKENFRDKAIIDRCDIIFVVWNTKSNNRIQNALAYAENQNKEVILINTLELT